MILVIISIWKEIDSMKFTSKGRTLFSNWYFEITNNNQTIDALFRQSPYTSEKQIYNHTDYDCLLWLENDTILIYKPNDILNIEEMKQLILRFFGV